MESTDIEVLRQTVHWLDMGLQVTLATIMQTWGSSPRLPGAMLAICEGGGQSQPDLSFRQTDL